MSKADFITTTGLELDVIQPTINWALELGYLNAALADHRKGKLFLNDLFEAFYGRRRLSTLDVEENKDGSQTSLLR